MSLDLFHPTVAAWFTSRFGAPTEIQALAWPRIAAGAHTLVVAPTGSGKTLTGFLWPLDRLLTGAWEGGGVRVLYVSPLKALNADIERNLEEPLAGLAAALEAAGEEPRPVRVGVRSGDTPPAERQRMLRRPPEILITTPESLNLLLLGKRAEALFRGLRLVLLDEIHAVAGSKRGTHLITAVERLTRVAGEFQRVAISATVRPASGIARFVGGARLERGAGGEARFERRPVEVVESRAAKRYELAVRHVGDLSDEALAVSPDALWLRLADELRARIAEVRSTLVFTNSRRLAERLTRLVNDAAGREVAWSHHGSLSRELRTTVERRLKRGELPALVATSSLELGIDVGALDRVLLAQAPRSFASAAQRIGRSGHRVGETSRAIFYPTHARDVVDCAVVARAVLDGELEPIAPVAAPLDLLAQTLLALLAHERWALDDLYDFVRTAEPYRELARRQFDLVVEMLAGRYEETRIAELRPRIALDRLTGTAQGLPGTARLLARAGGTIPDRGYFQLRLDDSNAKLGELDEEFVWERSVGDSFVLGAQAWRIRRITANEVFVSPARGGASLAPFWKADARDRGSYASERVARFLERANDRLADAELRQELERDWALEPAAAEKLLADLSEAREALGGTLPHRGQVVIEKCEERRDPARRAVLVYTFWGGSVNRPLALALGAAWEAREGEPIEANADDDAIFLVLPEGADPVALLRSVEPDRLDALLRARLESSGFFGAHFRQNAQRALLLPRAGPTKRTPLWLSRQNAKRLLEAVSRFDDFPLLAETWRTCLHDEFELDALRARLGEVASGAIRVAHVRTPRPSPLAANLVWRRTNELMYEDDTPSARRGSALSADLVREIALAGESAKLPPELVEAYRRRAQRLLPDYPPTSALELVEWVKERLWIPEGEWRELIEALERERADLPDELAPEVAPQLVRLDLGGAGVAARDTLLATRGPARLAGARARAGQAPASSLAPTATPCRRAPATHLTSRKLH
ncbi:MAG: DEAD/DEAH box helicase [Holophagales bacterium]|nr:DEAD/DEAH box helicase [Holophagales bacterium]